MKPIGRSFEQLKGRVDFRVRYNQIKESVLSDEDVRAFLQEHQKEIHEDMINRSLNRLFEYVQQSKGCSYCLDEENVNAILDGYHPKLVIKGQSIDIEYSPCPVKLRLDRQKKQQELMKSMYIPQNVLQATFTDLNVVGRQEVIQKVGQFLQSYDETGKGKGLYLHGKFGVGKTYILAAIAQQLAEKEYPSLLVYVPEFVRELKNSLADHTLESKLNMVKSTPILMLDDIGAESMTSWVRDELLGTILQYRMAEQLPTFFSSNFSPSELKHHFTYSQRGEKEEVKAARLMERILYLAEAVLLEGENRRHL
ncbi:primosomal protein DnaI [Bacillus pumilus]|uniref:primosomal protein DnaI n=1 Tax=Bacillus pumilus TaxID=1408 RepID=UPI00277DBD00|nr:primosomal protein DnaI [Bacillus pumilus]MDQ0817971.1 primosomal protein DnaI [Bacillus pumilus]